MVPPVLFFSIGAVCGDVWPYPARVIQQILPVYMLMNPTRPHLRGWSHVLAFGAAVTLCPLVIVFSPGQRLPVALYASSVMALFGISAAYHRVFWATRAYGFFRRLDHAMIFVAIAATYTPIVLAGLDGTPQRLVLWTVWLAAAAGVLTQLFWPGAPRWLTVTMYAVVGWIILPFVVTVWHSLGHVGFVLLLGGGLMHTAGAVVYATERPNPIPGWVEFHEVFHLCVIAAVALHYWLIAFFT